MISNNKTNLKNVSNIETGDKVMKNKSVINCANILNCFGKNTPQLGVTEIANRMGMHKSTIHHLLASLLEIGFLERTPDNKYKLGVKLFELGNLYLNNIKLEEIARPLLRELTHTFNECAHLGVLSGPEVVFLDVIHPEQKIKMTSEVGERMPLHCCALGKVFLSYQPDIFETYIKKEMAAKTAHTITDPQKLYEDIQLVKERGYADNYEESGEDLIGVAAPVFDITGHVVAAISVAGPSNRMYKIGIPELAAKICEASKAFSRSLGYGGGQTSA